MSRYAELVCLAANNVDGANWYSQANAEIQSVASAENWNPEYFAGILATTSPRCSVRRNVRIALTYCHNGQYLGNVMRGIRKSVENYVNHRTINGLKTGPFYRALCGDDTSIVLDAHMANLFGVPQKLFATKGGNSYYAGIVAGIATELSLSNAATQACLWYGQFRCIGRNPEFMPILNEYSNWLRQNREFPLVGTIAS